MQASGADIDQQGSLVTVKFASSHLAGIEMQEVVDDLMQHMRYDNAVLFLMDLSQVEYIASDCLGSLVMFMRDLEHIRGRIALANCHPNVAFLFKVTRLDAVFELYDDMDAAQTAIKQGESQAIGRR